MARSQAGPGIGGADPRGKSAQLSVVNSQTTVTVALILPRVAFEYGQTCS